MRNARPLLSQPAARPMGFSKLSPATSDRSSGALNSRNVRAIWEQYAGWFHHRSTTELYPVPPSAVAGDVVAAAGAAALLDAARAHLAAGRPVEALHLTDLVIAAGPASPAARVVAADATRAVLDVSTNFWEAAWLRRSIDRLERTP